VNKACTKDSFKNVLRHISPKYLMPDLNGHCKYNFSLYKSSENLNVLMLIANLIHQPMEEVHKVNELSYFFRNSKTSGASWPFVLSDNAIIITYSTLLIL